MLAAFTRAWGAAREIALKWKMHHGDLICALQALAPIEALARRLVFAEALKVKMKAPAGKRMPARAGAPKHVSPFKIVTLPHHPHAFFDACNPAPLIHLRQRHPLEAPQEQWDVRFCIATFATKAPSTGARAPSPASGLAAAHAGEGARAPGHAPSGRCEVSARDPIKLRESRRARRAREKAEREKRRDAFWYGDPDAPRVFHTAFDPRPFARFDTGAIARRTEAVRRIIAAPARFARALARRLRKHFDAIPRIVARLRRRRDEHAPLAMQCIDAALAAPDTS